MPEELELDSHQPCLPQSLYSRHSHSSFPDWMDEWKQSSPFRSSHSSKLTPHVPPLVPCSSSRQPSKSALAMRRSIPELLKDSVMHLG